MKLKFINPQIPKNIAESIEWSMITQGVDKIEDVTWLIFFKTMTKKELKKLYPDLQRSKK